MGLKRLFVWLLGLYQANNIVSAGWLVWMELVGMEGSIVLASAFHFCIHEDHIFHRDCIPMIF